LSRLRAAVPAELAGLLAVAFALRLGVFYFVPNIHWPDEIFQVLEPAHRLVFGTGAVSWEWVLGIRSWLLPGFLAGLMELGRLIGTRPSLINLPIEAFMAAAGVIPVLCAYLWGRRFRGRAGGFVAAAVAAIWVDLVYMSGHTFDEVLAADVLAAALYLGVPGDGAVLSRRRLWLVGGLLGLTFALRFHLGPALAVAAFGICGWRQSYRRWLALVAGACIPILGLGLLDWATLGVPFKSIFINVWVNLALGVSAEAGKEPFYTLWVLPFDIWGPIGFVAVLGSAVLGARRLPLLAAVVLTIMATHSLISHKEYRFIYPALPLVMILAGLGTGELLARLRPLLPRLVRPVPALAAVAVMLWGGLSYAVAQSAIFSIPWTRERAQLEAFRYVSDRPGACGVGLLGLRWPVTPGMSWLPPGVPLVQLGPASPPALEGATNFILARDWVSSPGDAYRRVRCFAGDRAADGKAYMRVCLWHRAGGCDGAAATALPVNWPGVLVRDLHQPPPPWDKEAARQ
jgi:GPI mannosyltransferase 3